MSETAASHLANNIKQLRETRGLTQDQLSKISGIPRPTWANVESGESNPTLTVLTKIAGALQVSIEELIRAPRSTTKLYKVETLLIKKRGDASIRALLPDFVGGLEFDRMEFPKNSRIVGAPHKTGTREYLVCETGQIELTVSGKSWTLSAGDVAVFRGDQKHSYRNAGTNTAVGFSVILTG